MKTKNKHQHAGGEVTELARETAKVEQYWIVGDRSEPHKPPKNYNYVAGMSRATQDATACREALARLPELDLGELRQQWRALYKADASPHLSRELLRRAVAYRIQEITHGGLRPDRQRQLRQAARQFNETGEIRRRARPELKSGTRLLREWRGRTYEVLVLDGGFSWQGTHYRSLSAVARKITGTAWSGPLFFGLKTNRSAALGSAQGPHAVAEDGDAAE